MPVRKTQFESIDDVLLEIIRRIEVLERKVNNGIAAGYSVIRKEDATIPGLYVVNTDPNSDRFGNETLIGE